MNLKQIKEDIHHLKLSNPNMSAYEILRKQNFVLGYMPIELNDELPKGCYFEEGNLRIVLIPENLDEDKAKVVYTHKLGHIIQHPKVNTLFIDSYDPVFIKKVEFEADIFASEFLLDNNVFEKYANKSIYEISILEKVPVRLVNLKYKNLYK